MSINELLSIVKPGEEEKEPLTDDQHTLKRPRKCLGRKLLHDEHTFCDPGPHCAGPDDTHLSDDGNLPPDEENDLLEQVKQLKLKEEALAKTSRIENLELEVAERQCRIEQLTKLQGPTTGEHSLFQRSKSLLQWSIFPQLLWNTLGQTAPKTMALLLLYMDMTRKPLQYQHLWTFCSQAMRKIRRRISNHFNHNKFLPSK